jgi:uncharacterized membrane protein YbhN (UPF0104 family)
LTRIHRSEAGTSDAGGRPATSELFAPEGDRRVRRVGDAVAVVVSVASLLVLGLVAVPLSGIEEAVVQLIDALPGWFSVLWKVVLLAGVAWCLALPMLALVRRRAVVARDVVVAALLAVSASLLVGWAVTGTAGSGFVLFDGGRPGAYPAVPLAVLAAVVSTSRPHLAESARRASRWLLVASSASGLILQLTTPVGAAMALLLGWSCAAVVHLLFGTDEGIPLTSSVQASLHRLGLEVTGLHPARRQRQGVFTLEGETADGREVQVKVYGRDARDTQALARTWRGLWYRNSEALTQSRAQQVEREAFATLLLGSRGVVVPEVLVAGVDEGDDAVLALAPRGVPLVPGEDLHAAAERLGGGDPDHEDRSSLDDRQIEGMWDLLDAVHAANLSFGDLGAESFRVVDRPEGEPVDVGAGVCFGDLSTVSAATSPEDRSVDRAQLLVCTVCLVGQERAVRAARSHLGADGLGELLAYVQPAALGSRTRAAARASKLKVNALRASIAASVELDAPEIARLRRVSSAALLRMGLITLVAYAVISAVTKVDTQELVDTFRAAEWTWVVLALLLAQLAIASQSITTQGASPRHLPYGPLTLLQFTIAFVALAVPSSAARVATVIRFFQRHGVTPAAATAVSMVDSFTGFLVQVAVLLLVLTVGIGDVQLDLSNTSRSSADLSGLVQLLVVVAVVVALLAVLAVVVPGIRRRILGKVRPWLSDMSGIVRGIRGPRRLVQLFGGNLLAQVLFAFSLGACVQAFTDHGVTLAEMLVVYIAAALFGGFMPVPGGIGVMEAALTAGLEAVGVQSAPAFGAAITFRLCTFYVPPLWGAAAMSALQRRGDL